MFLFSEAFLIPIALRRNGSGHTILGYLFRQDETHEGDMWRGDGLLTFWVCGSVLAVNRNVDRRHHHGLSGSLLFLDLDRR